MPPFLALWFRRLWPYLAAGLLVASALTALYYRGVRAGERRIQAQARADSVAHATAALRDSVQKVNALLEHAAATKPAVVARGATRTSARARVELVDATTARIDGILDTLPAPVISLIQADDAKIAADSAHMASLDSLPAAFAGERAAHAERDTLVDHQVQAESEGGGGTSIELLVAIAAVITAIVALFRH